MRVRSRRRGTAGITARETCPQRPVRRLLPQLANKRTNIQQTHNLPEPAHESHPDLRKQKR